jgi:ParB family transcriptional regulator, chromosome partitioning protein
MKNYEHKLIKTSDLIPYANNSRTHSDEQINQVASSIKEFGFTNPVLIDEQNGLIAGHGRVMAANKLGLDEVPAIILEGLTDAQKKAYVIADNQLALNSGWDLDMLRLEVETLQELDFDVDLLGFDDDVIAKLVDIDCEMPILPDGDRDPFQQKTFTLHDEQANLIDDAITKAKTSPLIDTGINENSNGNAIAWICEQWLKGDNDGEC